MEKHTPTPWIISELNDAIDGEEDILIEYQGFPILTVRGTNDMSCIDNDEEIEKVNQMVIANAELIVKAVNYHQQLVDQLRKLTEYADKLYIYTSMPPEDKSGTEIAKSKSLLYQLETH